MSTLGKASRGVPRLRVTLAVNCTGSRIVKLVPSDEIPAPLLDDLCSVLARGRKGGNLLPFFKAPLHFLKPPTLYFLSPTLHFILLPKKMYVKVSLV